MCYQKEITAGSSTGYATGYAAGSSFRDGRYARSVIGNAYYSGSFYGIDLGLEFYIISTVWARLKNEVFLFVGYLLINRVEGLEPASCFGPYELTN